MQEHVEAPDAFAILGVEPGADAAALRAAYLSKVREHPPESDAQMFERVRDAYRALTDPVLKMRRFFDTDELRQLLGDLAGEAAEAGGGRVFLGVDAWRELLRQAERAAREERG